MNTIKSFNSENDFFRSFVEKSVGVIKVINNPFDKITDVIWNNKIIDLISYAEKDCNIHSILFITELEFCKESYYEKFLNSIFIKPESDGELPKAKSGKNHDERIRQINLLDRLIINLTQFSKISIFAIQGSVVTPFIGLSLAADYRIGSTNLEFSFSHTKYGVHPTGALPFFLKQYLSPGLYKKYLFEGGTLTAEKSLELNLIHKLIDEPNFEKDCIDYAEKLSQNNLNVVKSTKYLLNDPEELKKYFDIESSLFFS